MAATIRARIEVKHRRGCSAVLQVTEGRWPTPWSLPCREKPVLRVPRGGWAGWWIRYRCNDTQCPGILLVDSDGVLRAVKP